MIRHFSALAALVLCACAVRADTPLWVDRPEAQAWLPALSKAADQADLPVALLAELVGIESGFKNVKNPHSSAAGFGQQINGNMTMWRYGLDRRVPEESILGAALQFREGLDRTHTITGAAAAYGTTAHLPAARRRVILARLEAAARRYNSVAIAQNVKSSIDYGKVTVKVR